ncbi:MAG: hypothetical protein ACOC8N_06570 [Spirochaetota bacterium]
MSERQPGGRTGPERELPGGESTRKSTGEGSSPEVVFHYNREKRLGKLQAAGHSRRRFFSKRRRRTLIIVLVDLLLVAAVLYFMNRPVNVYVTGRSGVLDYEVNVSEIRGDKVLIGFTVRNRTGDEISLSGAGPVVLEIEGPGASFSRSRAFQEDSLAGGESSSVVFLFDRSSLPATASIRVYCGGDDPVFQQDIRF